MKNKLFFMTMIAVTCAIICYTIMILYAPPGNNEIEAGINRLRMDHQRSDFKIQDYFNFLTKDSAYRSSSKPHIIRAGHIIRTVLEFHKEAVALLSRLKDLSNNPDSAKTAFSMFELRVDEFEREIKDTGLRNCRLNQFLPKCIGVIKGDLYFDYIEGVSNPVYELNRLTIVNAVDQFTLETFYEVVSVSRDNVCAMPD